MDYNKRVSIIVPNYNGGNTIEECINSVLNQTYQNFEIIVVDDGSTDNSIEILRKYTNENIKIIYQPNKGASSARNHGIKYATGDYIQFLDADDTLSPNKIESQIQIFKKLNYDENIVVFGKWAKLGCTPAKINKNQKSVWHSYNNPTDILIDFALNNCCLPPNTYLIHKNIIIKAGLWNESLSRNDDGEFIARILDCASTLYFCEESISFYRSTPNSLSKRMNHKAAKSQIESQIMIAEIMMRNNNPLKKEAVYKMLNSSLKLLYPYYAKERLSGEKYLVEKLEMNATYPSLNFKEKLYYLLHPLKH